MSDAPSPLHAVPAQGGSHRLRQRAAKELRSITVIVVYLWALLALFDLYRTIILDEAHVSLQEQGFAFINALVLGKVMFIAEALNVGTRFRDRALIWSILYGAFTFALVLMIFHVIEHVAVGALHGQHVAESIQVYERGGWKGLVARALIMFVALIPFFGFREVSRAIGPKTLHRLLFERGAKFPGPDA
ncbi:conserved membrane protein of unknown function [Rhodovastum atsumiense]|uniref:Uncharacterized protein n=1 Tax=Rhodovastum atsumiense TaxID=504468 RepID=A0A5M6IP02_9PROT|nr:hypothetical protein [Rhodovastum atsumiense]KAA5609195.1 hypothetical protein F1189_25185 [Rhodovastum atsumiense]CAH2603980.1 conserved membrane protein of unknown function [Rhodovastum atsumiense]